MCHVGHGFTVRLAVVALAGASRCMLVSEVMVDSAVALAIKWFRDQIQLQKSKSRRDARQ